MRSLRMALLASLGLFGLLPGVVGCAGSDQSDDVSVATGASSAATTPTVEEEAGAFSVDYTIGWLTGATFATIDAKKLGSVLPEGDARTYAQCLAARHAGTSLGNGSADPVHGETLVGKTWKHGGATYYVLAVDLEDSQELHDVAMAFVFSPNGASRFQALTWDGKRNVKIAFKSGSPCTSSAPIESASGN